MGRGGDDGIGGDRRRDHQEEYGAQKHVAVLGFEFLAVNAHHKKCPPV